MRNNNYTITLVDEIIEGRTERGTSRKQLTYGEVEEVGARN